MALSRKILLLEDNELQLELLKISTRKSVVSFDLDVCKTIWHAKEYLRDNTPDMIVSDYLLPDGTGEELLDHPKVKDKLPIVFMSSQGTEELAVSLIKKGALDYLVKSHEFFREFPLYLNRAFREWENIVARKDAETRLVHAESKYKLVTDNINDVIWELSKDFTRYLFISQSVKDFLGYDEEEFVKIPFEQTVHPDSMAEIFRVKAQYQSHKNSGLPPQDFSIIMELQFLHKDGSIRWGEIRGFLVVDNENEVTSISGVTRNISSQKAAEKKLKIQEAYFETLIQEAPSAIVILDKNDKVRQVNKQFSELFGYSSDECYDKDLIDLIVPENLKAEGRQLTEDVTKGEYITRDTIRQNKKGEFIHVSIYGKPVFFDNKLIAVFGIYQDISRQKKTEDRLQTISERLILATNAASIGIWDFDLKSHEVFWEPEMYKLHEIDQNNESGLMKLWEGVVVEDDKALLDFIFNQKEFYKDSFENVYRIKCKSGDLKYIRLFAKVHFDNSRKSTRIVGCCLDITSQVENTELSKQVEISAKVASIKQQFLANMSHEIRSPVTGILGMADLLMKSPLDKKQLFYAQTIKESSDSLLQIVNDILDLSKIEVGKMDIKPSWFNLRDCGKRIFNLFHALAEQKGLKLSYSFDSTLPFFVFGDEHRISQIVTNLVSNAIKFTEQGWVKIVFQNTEDHQDFAKIGISVLDSGIGISRDDMSKLFSIFTQVDNSDTRNYEGTGLGLAISEKLAELMHAKIQVESKQGEGSSFSLNFISPKSSDLDHLISDPEEKEYSLETAGEKKYNILLVEDKQTNQLVVSLMLKEFGHKVDIAGNGQVALDMMEPGKYDFIFMDIQMPVMDGLTAVRKLRSKYREDELPLIIGLSAKAMEGDAEYYISRGMNDYLTKPVNTEILRNCLHKYSSRVSTVKC